jgi:hypothetical protein
MKTTERERFLITLLPFALVLGGYAWWLNLFAPFEVGNLEKKRQEAAKEAVRPVEVMEQKARVAMLQRELTQLEGEGRALDARMKEASATLGGSMKRMQAVEALTTLFAAHRLAIVQDCPAGNRHNTKIPPCLSEATQRLSGSSGDKSGYVRCVHFQGRYMDVLAALEAIARDESFPVVPIGLTMDEADANSDVRTWMLAVWM